MTQRAYTVAEIDRMRAAVDVLSRNYMGGGYFPPKSVDVEDKLRTYMLNGTCPEELESAAVLYEERHGDD